jgi:hypothetical protein
MRSDLRSRPVRSDKFLSWIWTVEHRLAHNLNKLQIAGAKRDRTNRLLYGPQLSQIHSEMALRNVVNPTVSRVLRVLTVWPHVQRT